jgi:energy-coupling factor transporter ATP-binding protein EcfA2
MQAESNRISEQHWLELERSGIRREVADSAGLVTEYYPDLIQELLDWNHSAGQLGACLVFPYYDVHGKNMGYSRLKPSVPRKSYKDTPEGKTIKYEAPVGKPNRLYIPPSARDAILHPTKPIIITEGEKKALSAASAAFDCISIPGVWAWQVKRLVGADGRKTGNRQLIPDLQEISWTDRCVFIAFDSDASSNSLVLMAEKELRKVLMERGAKVTTIRLPAASDGSKQGVDDYLVALGADSFRALMESSAKTRGRQPRKTTAAEQKPGAKAKEETPSPAQVIVQLVLERAKLWHDSHHRGYAQIGRRSYAIRSKSFKLWMIAQYRGSNEGAVPNSEQLANAQNSLEAEAVITGPLDDVYTRVAIHESTVYVFLADDEHTVISINADGWKVCDQPPVRFCLMNGTMSLPRPERGGQLDELRQLLNLNDLDQFSLIVGFICGSFRPGQPQPLLVANGEQGSGKSTISRVLKSLIDPTAAAIRCEPREVRDLMIAARNNHILAFDNMSHLPVWLSDALCRLVTGGGFATRELYSNDEEVVFDAKRPMILNGIEDFVTRGDLLERSLLLRLPTIAEEHRVQESVFWSRFREMHPRVLGAIFDRISGGLKEYTNVYLGKLPRMADFARWCVACEQGAGETPRFLAAYRSNQSGAHELALEGSSLAGEIVALMNEREAWEGTATELYKVLTSQVPNPPPRDWPKAANSLSAKLKRLAPNLRQVYRIDFSNDRHTNATRNRIIQLCRMPVVTDKRMSTPTDQLFNNENHVANSDDSKDDARCRNHGPSAVLAADGRLSDDADDADDLFRTPKVVSAAEFTQFLNMH